MSSCFYECFNEIVWWQPGKDVQRKIKGKSDSGVPRKVNVFSTKLSRTKNVVSKDSTLEENIDTLVDKRAYINKAAEYIREDIIHFFNEQSELSWLPNAQELISKITKSPDVPTDFLTELLMLFIINEVRK